MPEIAERTMEVEDLLDSVELLVESIREAHRMEGKLKAQEKLVKELATETRQLLTVVDAPPVPVPAAPAEKQPAHGKARVPKARPSGHALTRIDALLMKAYREKLGLSQAGLAKKVGVSGVHVCNVENGRAKPSAELLGRIRQALGMEAKV